MEAFMKASIKAGMESVEQVHHHSQSGLWELRIRLVSLSDSGQYRCQVSQGGGGTYPQRLRQHAEGF